MLQEQLKTLMTSILNSFALCGVIGIAFDQNDTPRRQHRVWMKEYPEYKEMFETINERFVDGLECVAIERAKEKSDALLQFLLKAKRPEVYNVTQNVNLNTPKDMTFIFPEGMLSEEEKKLLSREE